jgi:hypothetical protein
MQTNIFAYTAPGGSYPDYLSINRQDDGRVTITVRSPAKQGKGYPICGTVAELTLPGDHLGELIAALQEHRATKTPPKTPLPYPDWPRRASVPHMVPAELAIRDALVSVEKAGAHPLLTDAVNLLSQAREKVADFVDLDEPPFDPS